jgi:iron complex outermembrane recepter protein
MDIRKRTPAGLATATFAAAALAATTLAVAEPQQGAEAPSGGLEEVTVFAERRATGRSLKEVPMAVSAVNGDVIFQARMQNVVDIGRLAPNTQLDPVGTFPGFSNFMIRGVGNSNSTRSIDSPVNIVQDGMVIDYQAGAVLDTFDLESVEILRGPQGVLFGRNASGGAVALRSRRPTGEFDAYADLAIGNANSREINAALEGSLVPDRLSARIAVMTRENDGLVENTLKGTFVPVPLCSAVPAGTPCNVNNITGAGVNHPTGSISGIDRLIVRPTFVFTPSDTVKFSLMTQYQDFDDGGGVARAVFPPNGITQNQQRLWGFTPAPGKYEANVQNTGFTKIEAWHAIGELEWQLAGGLWTTIAAYRDLNYDATLHVSGDPFDTLVFPNNVERAEQSSVETRFNGSIGDKIEFLVGAFWLEADAFVQERRESRTNTSTLITYFDSPWTQTSESKAVFANVDYKFNDQWSGSAGVRYTEDDKDISLRPLVSCGNTPRGCDSLAYINDSRSWSNTSPRFVLRYQPSEDFNYYASFSKGYRAGNYNARVGTAQALRTPANPETNESIELGFKGEFLDGRLRTNVALFNADYTDIQRTATVPNSVPSISTLTNAGQATIRGFEIDGSWLVLDQLRIDFAYGLTDAQYDELVGVVCPCGDKAVATDLDFDRMAPWTASIAATWTVNIGEGELATRLQYARRPEYDTDFRNTVALRQPAFGLLDASVNYTVGPWQFSAFGRNLQNTEFVDILSLGLGYQAYGGQPRIYGVSVGRSFGRD